MRVLLDTNIVLDALLGRQPWKDDADAVFQASHASKLTSFVTSLTIANLYYVRRRLMGLDKARSGVRDCLDAFEILPVDRSTLESGLAFPGRDFEDNLQIVAAIKAGLDAVVTRNPGDFASCPLAVINPQQLLTRISGEKA